MSLIIVKWNTHFVSERQFVNLGTVTLGEEQTNNP